MILFNVHYKKLFNYEKDRNPPCIYFYIKWHYGL